MKKIIISASTVGAAAVAAGALGLFGAGIASAAPDVVGMTYGDAVSAIEDERQHCEDLRHRRRPPGRDGRLPCHQRHRCAVRARHAAGEFGHADGEVLLALNCNRGAATATTPGASLASPEGRDFQAAAEEAAAAQQNEQDELAQAGETPGDAAPEIPTG